MLVKSPLAHPSVGVCSYRAALELGNDLVNRHADRYLAFLQRLLDKLHIKVRQLRFNTPSFVYRCICWAEVFCAKYVNAVVQPCRTQQVLSSLWYERKSAVENCALTNSTGCTGRASVLWRRGSATAIRFPTFADATSTNHLSMRVHLSTSCILRFDGSSKCFMRTCILHICFIS
jgi:hypothetical protein